MRINLPLSSNKDGVEDNQNTRLVNMYIEPSEGGRFPWVAVGCPGLKQFVDIGQDILGFSLMANTLYVVTDVGLWSVSSAGVKTFIGELTPGKPIMANDGTQLAIAKGGRGYVYNGTLSQITDPDFPAVSSVTWQDQYFIWSTLNSGEYVWSALADATDYDALDFATAEVSPDPLVRVISDHQEIWMFGTQTVEIHRTTSGDPPFRRAMDAAITNGCLSAASIQPADNSLFWVGVDPSGSAGVFRANGYTPSRISSRWVDSLIEAEPNKAEISACTYASRGHIFYVVTLPNVGVSLAYDASTGKWHERASYGRAAWRVEHTIYAFGRRLGGGPDGIIYEIDENTYSENDAPRIAKVVFPFVASDGKPIFVHRLELFVRPGVGLTAGQGSDPMVMLRVSKDGGRTWGNERWRGLGKIGEYEKRVRWGRLGQAKSFLFEVSVSDPVNFGIIGAALEVSGGD